MAEMRAEGEGPAGGLAENGRLCRSIEAMVRGADCRTGPVVTDRNGGFRMNGIRRLHPHARDPFRA